ncbi:uncharacterized protein BJ212DRAFT_1487013 [Suillus subaureus]|uniref:Uncharacterized protein n=1 Tax=Suillus subaureus TaxID=48587 RepID=A0A9P7DUR0_9AGAM|nr:uncharacterized protein BJ212DRAFT_1487013 [Suillus subaureus]KAG1803412.1 hypothetical protein BJ212DRAFT_1487013 [Suillus subaureus]
MALLHDFCFLFEDMDNLDAMQTFQSPFMLQLFATAHLHSIVGHAHVTVLKTDVLALTGMQGVIALCTTSLERAIKWLHKGTVDIDAHTPDVGPAQMKCKLRMPKTFNPATGKDSTIQNAFSIGNWGDVTAAYIISVRAKGDIFMKDLVSTACKLLKKKLGGLDKYLHLSDEDNNDDNNDDNNKIDHCTLLW